MCGKFADILETKKAFSVDFILRHIRRNMKTKITTVRVE